MKGVEALKLIVAVKRLLYLFFFPHRWQSNTGINAKVTCCRCSELSRIEEREALQYVIRLYEQKGGPVSGLNPHSLAEAF